MELPPSPVDKWLIGYTLTTLLVTTVALGSEFIAFYVGLNYKYFTRVLCLSGFA